MATYKCPNCGFVFGNRFANGKYTKSSDGYRECPNCHKPFAVGTEQKAFRLTEWVLKALVEWSEETGLTQKEIVNIAITEKIREWDKIRRDNIAADSSAKDKTEAGRAKRLKGIPQADKSLGKLVQVQKLPVERKRKQGQAVGVAQGQGKE